MCEEIIIHALMQCYFNKYRSVKVTIYVAQMFDCTENDTKPICSTKSFSLFTD